ncbi:hypothetical protein THIOM_001476 [Candidatus Thiomargarita nelsonii]|uniref:Uncharacterized protein n=1 Tax=Candidatus Thiomargarita nelsonii TaxID=1003181 RepID=A0A176S3W8_9GAMM|nr:hypothetical protein THIOM_001476 [Candidatus Thiomargarita nelsonii]
MRMYLINNERDRKKPPFMIGEQFHKALKQLGFIEQIDLENISIEISGSTQGQGHLQRIFITDLETISSIKEIWKINLEQDIEGISTKSRTTEVALLMLQAYQSTYRLNVVLIELKTSLQAKKLDKGKRKKSTLCDIEDKYRCTMNRLYMLLTINNHSNVKKAYGGTTIYIDFKGIIFYNQDKTKISDSCELYQLFKQAKESQALSNYRLLECQTILSHRDKIQVKFLENPFIKKHNPSNEERESFEISIKELISA